MRIASVAEKSARDQCVDDVLRFELGALELRNHRVAQHSAAGQIPNRRGPRESDAQRFSQLSEVDILDDELRHAVIHGSTEGQAQVKRRLSEADVQKGPPAAPRAVEPVQAGRGRSASNRRAWDRALRLGSATRLGLATRWGRALRLGSAKNGPAKACTAALCGMRMAWFRVMGIRWTPSGTSSKAAVQPMEDAKRRVARAALDEIPNRGVLGLGTGSTARLFIEELAVRVRGGWTVVGVPTSEATRAHAASLGIPLLDDVGPWGIDVNVDGADEVSASLDLIKGGGGAHAREKIVNHASARNVVIVDATKISATLGARRAVPVEVLPFAHATTAKHLALHGRPRLRIAAPDTLPFRTDAGNFIYDLTTGPIDDPAKLDVALHAIPGVVETGLFVGRADVVLVGDAGGVRRIERATGARAC